MQYAVGGVVEPKRYARLLAKAKQVSSGPPSSRADDLQPSMLHRGEAVKTTSSGVALSHRV